MTVSKLVYALISTVIVGGLSTQVIATKPPAVGTAVVKRTANQTALVYADGTAVPLQEWVPVDSVWDSPRVIKGRLVSGVLIEAPGGKVCRSALTPQQLTGAWTGARESGTYVVLQC
jgi:hypothetical protein